MKVVILCGGLGSRLAEETKKTPKPMIKIGKFPIIFHIMKHYSNYNFKEFIICSGYKHSFIKLFTEIELIKCCGLPPEKYTTFALDI